MDNYVSLHNHTHFSLLHSLIRPKDLFSKVKELNQPAVAVTDSGTLFGAWDCLQISKQIGVKLIIGCEFFFVEEVSNENSPISHVILLAKNYLGYKNLLLASKLGYDNSIVKFGKVLPRIDWSILEKCSEGIICTTACGSGILSQLINTRKETQAFERAKKLKDIFNENLALEIQPHAMVRQANPFNDYEDQRLVNTKLVKFGDELGIKVIAATDAHYLTKDQWEAHDTILSIGCGIPIRARARPRYPSHEFYVKTREEIVKFLDRYFVGRGSEFCDNTLYFAEMCEEPDWIDPKFSNPSGKELPEFPVRDQLDYSSFKDWIALHSEEQKLSEDVAYLRYWCECGLKEKAPADKIDEYKERIKLELDVIEQLGFSSYMLIVADIINFCDRNKYPHGLGRGSCGGCLVAYLIGIHQADPIKYELIFERFLNKEKTNYPDIDSDFAAFVKPKVEEYLVRKYGVEYVAHVSNINTITPKVYARDIARAFEFGGDRKTAVEVGTAIADSIPDDCHTLQSAFKNAPLFQEFADSEKYDALKKFADDIGGLPRAMATHAGGLVIGKRPLHEIIPVRRDKDGNVAIEYEKERAEANGLVKMDILGLSTLDIIQNTLGLIKRTGKNVPTSLSNFDVYDKPTYDLISRGDTLCVFQLGTSGGTIDLCKQIKPKSIQDIAIINSLARPSARDIRKDFIATKNGNKPIEIMHPSLQRAFGNTYGFGLYEESLMYLAQDVAGWNLNQADRLRKLTKEKGKNPKKVKQWRAEFINDAIINGVSNDIAVKIWDNVVDKFQGYGFNLSHAIFYSMLGYQTAFLKAHFPIEFLTANLILEDESNAKISDKNIANIKREMRQTGIKILPPDVNKSQKAYKILNDSIIITGFNSLKYMGKDAIPDILEKRPFSSFEDLMEKIDASKARVTAIQALIGAGALDSFGLSRKLMFLYVSDYRKKLQAWKKRNTIKPFKYPWPKEIGEWSLPEKYAMETYYLGESFCCGIKEAYHGFFDNQALDFSKLSKLFPDPGSSDERFFIDSSKHGVVEGVIRNYFEFKVKNEKSKIFGQVMAKIDLEDIYGNIIPMTIFPSGLESFNNRLRLLINNKAIIEPGVAIHCAASINWYEGDISLIFEDLKKAAPLPPMPQDIKHKKVSMRSSKSEKQVSELNADEFLDQIEDELILEGFFTGE